MTTGNTGIAGGVVVFLAIVVGFLAGLGVGGVGLVETGLAGSLVVLVVRVTVAVLG